MMNFAFFLNSFCLKSSPQYFMNEEVLDTENESKNADFSSSIFLIERNIIQ